MLHCASGRWCLQTEEYCTSYLQNFAEFAHLSATVISFRLAGLLIS